MGDLEHLGGQHVIVCGASTGIGRAMALQYAKSGARVVAAARTPMKLEALATEARNLKYPGQIIPLRADFSQSDGAAGFVEEALRALDGRLDILVLNHIRPFFELVEHSRPETLREVLDVNLASYIFLTQEALPALLASQGSLVAMSSVAGKIGVPYCAVYAAAKHGLHGFFDSLRLELELKHGPDHGMAAPLLLPTLSAKKHEVFHEQYSEPLIHSPKC